MKRPCRSLHAIAAAVALSFSSSPSARGQSSAEVGRPTAPNQADGGVEGGLFEVLHSGEDITVLTDTTDGNVTTIPIGEPEDRLPIYRTICVRLCDGYYFPMSPSSSRNDFARDQHNCESICPGAEMRTYYQPSSQHSSGTMMSAASDEPYAELATAYLYRRPDAPESTSCGCRGMAAESGYSILGGEGLARFGQTPGSSILYPGVPPAQEAAPEAREDVGTQLRRTRAEIGPSGDRKVRVVGPEFLPGREAAEVPPVQVPTTGR